MKHAILGAGAIGSLAGTALGSIGEDVTMIVRAERLSDYPHNLSLERPPGSEPLTAAAEAVTRLEELVDVLWIATKTYQLQNALELIRTPPRYVVPIAEWH